MDEAQEKALTRKAEGRVGTGAPKEISGEDRLTWWCSEPEVET